MDKEIRCAIYTRKSKKSDPEQILNSLEAQRMVCEEYIKKQQGFIILPKKYEDDGKSGENLRRSAIIELLCDIKKGEVDCVVVYKLDRLSRDTDDGEDISKMLRKLGVGLIAVTQPFDQNTSVGRFMRTILTGQAQLERDMITERVLDKIAMSKQQGLWMGGTVPLGYDAKDKKLVINEEEAEVVKHIFKRFIELKSIAQLTKELNNQGYRTKTRVCKSGTQGGGLFGTAAVRAIITNLTYIGQVKHKDKCYQGIHKAIIEEEVWNKAQTLIEKRPNYQEKYEEGILKGIIRCQLCNASMIPTYTKKPNKLYRYYVCDNHVERKLCPSMKRRISAGEVERIVIEKTRYVNSIRGSGALEEIWENLFPLKQKEIIRKLVRMVWVREGGIELLIGVKELEEVRDEYPTDMETKAKQGDCRQFEEVNGEISLFVPCKLRREAGKCTILEPENEQYTKKDNTLLKALANAHLWQRQLNRGKYANIRELRKEKKQDPHKILKLNLLAPEIKRDILNGKQPRHLKLADFKKEKIPILWSEQLKKFYG